jgi:hypothetical protein
VVTPKKPPFLYVLAAFGLVLGTLGGMDGATSVMAYSALSRDEYTKVRQQALLGDQSDPALIKLIERHADVEYARRNVAIPLGAMNFILSSLLFLGCGRALRGQAWGLSAWQLAAAASIPYTVLACAFWLVRARELDVVYQATELREAVSMSIGLSVLRLLMFFKTALELLYFAASWLYLRRPQVRALFPAA